MEWDYCPCTCICKPRDFGSPPPPQPPHLTGALALSRAMEGPPFARHHAYSVPGHHDTESTDAARLLLFHDEAIVQSFPNKDMRSGLLPGV